MMLKYTLANGDTGLLESEDCDLSVAWQSAQVVAEQAGTTVVSVICIDGPPAPVVQSPSGAAFLLTVTDDGQVHAVEVSGNQDLGVDSGA